VRRLLTKAKNEGIVRIEIDSGSLGNSEEISLEMKERFGLKNVIVADEGTEVGTITSIAISAAKFLPDYVKNGQLVGISWGRTLYETVERVVLNGELPNTKLIPLIGGVGQLRHEYQINSIVEKMQIPFTVIVTTFSLRPS
jgi:deoxyribonucleoside regulator